MGRIDSYARRGLDGKMVGKLSSRDNPVSCTCEARASDLTISSEPEHTEEPEVKQQ